MDRAVTIAAIALITLIPGNLSIARKAYAEEASEAGLPFGLRGISWEMTPREIYNYAKSSLYMECTPFSESSFYCVHPGSSRQWPHAIEESWFAFGLAGVARPNGVPENGEFLSFGCEFLSICSMHVSDVAMRLLDLEKMIITGREEGSLGSIHHYGQGHRGEIIVLNGYPSVQSHIPANIGTVITVYRPSIR